MPLPYTPARLRACQLVCAGDRGGPDGAFVNVEVTTQGARDEPLSPHIIDIIQTSQEGSAAAHFESLVDLETRHLRPKPRHQEPTVSVKTVGSWTELTITAAASAPTSSVKARFQSVDWHMGHTLTLYLRPNQPLFSTRIAYPPAPSHCAQIW
ncbi:hypothetical protein J1614_002864 [Plenodomus biglobosus]|nr:hypothetical protein J1614_002864 [Plenodomus biglobosus]